MTFRSSILIGASLMIAPAAFAQDMQPQTAPAQTAPAPTAPATTEAPAATATTPAPVSDTEVNQFAKAALAVNDVQKDTAIPAADKGAKMADAVKMAGLEPNRFNEISQAMQADPALNKKIQMAAAEQQKAAAPGSSAPATPAGS